jgi:hypothetical protein
MIFGQEQNGCSPHLPVLSTSGSQCFLFVSENKTETKREEIQQDFVNSTKIKSNTTRGYKPRGPEVLPAMAELLDMVHYLTRGLL